MIFPEFEKFVFVLNEIMQDQGWLEADKYISAEILIFSAILSLSINALFIWIISLNTKYFEKVAIHLMLYICIPITVIVTAYYAPYVLMSYLLLGGFVWIVLSNKKYVWIRDKLMEFY